MKMYRNGILLKFYIKGGLVDILCELRKAFLYVYAERIW